MVMLKSSDPRSPSENESDDDSRGERPPDEAASSNGRSSSELPPSEPQSQALASQQADSDKLKRRPFCSRCRNHGKIAHVRGHKRRCEFRACQCDGCQLVECRQLVSAAQIKRRRDMKQDEECGRKTEVTPPVLKRRRSEDLATLIAKKLIGSAGERMSSPLEQRSAALAPANPSHQPPAFSISPLVSASDSLSSSQLHSPNPTVYPQPELAAAASELRSAQSLFVQQANEYPTQPSASAFLHFKPLGQASAAAMNIHDSHNPLQPMIEAPSLVGRLHPLFQFPGSMLASPFAPSNHQQVDTRGGSLPPAAPTFYPHHHHPNASHKQQPLHQALHHALNDFRFNAHQSRHLANPSEANAKNPKATPTAFAATSPPLRSLREQISIVEDIYQTCGRLAIYALLLSEQFDLRKVRELIESCKPHYDQLVESECRSSLANHDGDKQQASLRANGADSPRNDSNQRQDGDDPRHEASVDGARRISDCNSRDTSLDRCPSNGDASDPRSNERSSSRDKSSLLATSTTPSLVSVSPSIDRQTFTSMSTGQSFPFHTVANLVNSVTSVSGSSRADQLQPANTADPYKVHRNMSPLRNHLNQVPLGIHPNFLWQNFKSLGTSSSGLTTAAHLMPNIMDHPLVSHDHTHLRSGLSAHKHAQEIHSNILKASTASASSSSTVL